jgi:hypothetical protein
MVRQSFVMTVLLSLTWAWIGLGQDLDEKEIALLVEVVGNEKEEPFIRYKACERLLPVATKARAVIPSLIKAFQHYSSPEYPFHTDANLKDTLLEKILDVLSAAGWDAKTAVPVLTKALETIPKTTRFRLADADRFFALACCKRIAKELGRFGANSRAAMPALLAFAKGEFGTLSAEGYTAGNIRNEIFKIDVTSARAEAIEALGKIAHPSDKVVCDSLRRMKLLDPYPQVQRAAETALAAIEKANEKPCDPGI